LPSISEGNFASPENSWRSALCSGEWASSSASGLVFGSGLMLGAVDSASFCPFAFLRRWRMERRIRAMMSKITAPALPAAIAARGREW